VLGYKTVHSAGVTVLPILPDVVNGGCISVHTDSRTSCTGFTFSLQYRRIGTHAVVIVFPSEVKKMESQVSEFPSISNRRRKTKL